MGKPVKKKAALPLGWSAPVLNFETRPYPSMTRHDKNVRALNCVVTDRPGVTLHHVHGRSVGRKMVELGMDPVNAMGRRGYSDALVIPLVLEFHSYGPYAIDGQMGVEAWEERFGSQVDHVDTVSRLLGYDLWEMHRFLMSLKSKSKYFDGLKGSHTGV